MKAFHKVDKNRDGYGTLCDLHRILQKFNYYLDHNQFNGILNRFVLLSPKHLFGHTQQSLSRTKLLFSVRHIRSSVKTDGDTHMYPTT